ncbi:alpha/beta fold hydrolase [Nocardioides humi]|uniref:Alpha/beta hydrolase n=1 Tax=Nocardioides humi TaxID=449461 RepID=A0ABN2BV26_9ACTN|nr:alpha/beta hydrolase [Nocardioides humi]
MEFTPSSVQLPEGRLRYRVVGPEDGDLPAVVFVHGFLVDGRLWDAVARSLAEQGMRCYLPDLPLGSHVEPVGHPATLSPLGVARLVRALLAELDLADVTLVGNDSGGAICQFLLDDDPSRVGRLVLTNCDAHDIFPPFPFNVLLRLARSPRVARALVAPLRWRLLRHSPLGFGLLARDPDAALTASWLEPARTRAPIRDEAATFLRAVDPAELARVTPRMSRYDGPVTLVWGMADRCFTPAFGRRLAAAFPDPRFVEVPGARTFVSLDAPDAVAREVVAVLDR